MSSKKYAAPLQFKLGPSRSLTVILSSVYISALTLVFVMPIELWQRLLAVLFLVPAAYLQLGLHALKRLPVSIVGVIWDYDDLWFLQKVSGDQVSAMLNGSSFVHQQMCVLNFKVVGSEFTQTVIILPDNIDKNTFRQLRVRLKISNLNDLDQESLPH